MAIGKVTVDNLNTHSGETPEIEKKALFVGVSASGRNAVAALNAASDLVELFGAKASGTLVKQLEAAQKNGGRNWQAYAVGIDDAANWETAVDLALATKNIEYIVVTDPVTAKAQLEALQTKAVSILNSMSRRLFFIACTAGIDPATQTWAQYRTAMAAVTDGVAAARVLVVPNLFGTDLGALAGRLATDKASVADSPMRVNTGAVLGLDPLPSDKDGRACDMANVTALHSERLACMQWYEDYPGYYFTDGSTLDAPGGDYQAVENLRVADKAARRVRILAIARIADRKLNSTKRSIAANKNYLATPLRQMAKSYKLRGELIPGEIGEPDDDAVTIDWIDKTSVRIGIELRPYNAPKNITVGIALDLSDNA